MEVAGSCDQGERSCALPSSVLGAELYALLRRRFRPVDHVAVVRGSRKLEQPVFHGAAAEENFFLRGFNHLLVFKKERRRAAGDGR